jgi:S-adenosylmethionine:tRNA ribosyltransferase-isomerase
MKGATLDEHVMHEEWADVPQDTREAIKRAKADGRRVIVVGTTAMRALESGIESGFTKLFITPGYEFKIADGLITNFHLPKSTLIVLVSSFAGREHVMDAYKHAIDHGYRFYSFGDAMLIV